MTIEICIQSKTGSCLGCPAHEKLGTLVKSGVDVGVAAEQVRKEACEAHGSTPQTHNLDLNTSNTW